MNSAYDDYYITQAGNGVGNVFKGHAYQRGSGLGSFLKGLFRSVVPLFKSGIRTVGKEAMKSGSYILSDLASERPFAESIKERFDESVQNLKRKASQKLSGGGRGIKRQRKQSKRQSSSSTRRVKTALDIFDNLK